MSRIMLVHWDAEESADEADRLSSWGHEVVAVEWEDGGRAWRKFLDARPEVLVVRLERKTAHGRETAAAIRQTRTGRTVPIVFVGGEPDRVGKVALMVPDGIFTTDDELRGVLAGLDDG